MFKHLFILSRLPQRLEDSSESLEDTTETVDDSESSSQQWEVVDETTETSEASSPPDMDVSDDGSAENLVHDEPSPTAVGKHVLKWLIRKRMSITFTQMNNVTATVPREIFEGLPETDIKDIFRGRVEVKVERTSVSISIAKSSIKSSRKGYALTLEDVKSRMLTEFADCLSAEFPSVSNGAFTFPLSIFGDIPQETIITELNRAIGYPYTINIDGNSLFVRYQAPSEK